MENSPSDSASCHTSDVLALIAGDIHH